MSIATYIAGRLVVFKLHKGMRLMPPTFRHEQKFVRYPSERSKRNGTGHKPT